MHNASRPIQFRKYESNFRKPCISFSSKSMTTIAERTSRTKTHKQFLDHVLLIFELVKYQFLINDF